MREAGLEALGDGERVGGVGLLLEKVRGERLS